MDSKAMGALLNQDGPQADMIRLACSTDNHLLSLVTHLASPNTNNKLALYPSTLYPSLTWAVATGAGGYDDVRASLSPTSGGGHGHRGSFSLKRRRGGGGGWENGDGAITAARVRMAVAFSPPPPPSLGRFDFLGRCRWQAQHGFGKGEIRWGDPQMGELHVFETCVMDGMCSISQAARQIYITFPAASTFTEDEVSAYFSGFGPVQEARIPQQARQMFGFIAFVYPKSVRLVLAKGNPHLVCGSRVLVSEFTGQK
ncbi:hypothetical protein BRADI_1g22618v3 [Brachypodium distachyon]|uniref:RRM domain-containing protein n=1 Tax=Brachypodium distachyon TaxID=15368 RepID=A0A0Q3NDX9_BRADI|nr:hypothetical protein BRADI_1g22618v3 [Brachypodium distachyon]